MVDSVIVHNHREWEKLDGLLQGLYDHFENDAVRIGMNKVAAKCKTNLVRAIAGEPLQQSLAGAFREQQLPRLPPVKVRNKDVRPLIYVRAMKKKHFDSNEKQSATILGYANDIPAIRIATTKRQAKTGGGSIAKGGITHTATHGKPRKGSRPGTKGRKLKKATQGGIKINGVVLEDAFINVARYNKQVHIFRRMTPKTWKDGKHGWGHDKDKAEVRLRARTGVVRYDIKTPMEVKMPKVVAFTVAVNANDEVNSAMNYLIDKEAAKNFK